MVDHPMIIPTGTFIQVGLAFQAFVAIKNYQYFQGVSCWVPLRPEVIGADLVGCQGARARLSKFVINGPK